MKHIRSGKCAKPIGAVTDDVVLGMYSSCEGHKFSFTAGGSLQHIASRKCVNPKSGVSIEMQRNIWIIICTYVHSGYAGNPVLNFVKEAGRESFD